MENIDLTTQLNIADVVAESVVDGLGIRMTLFTQGCPHHCKGCHNQSTWDFGGGKKVSIERLIGFVKANPLLDGVTFSGGEPFAQATNLAIFAKWLHANGYNIWCYTGYTLEELLIKQTTDNGTKELLALIDVLVDGKFVESQLDLKLKFRGSSNQRVINMLKTRQANYQTIVWLEDM